MGRIYTAVFERVSVSAVQDFFEIVAPSDAAVVIHSANIAQDSDTDSEQLNILVHRGSTSGSGGSSVTPSPLEVGDAAFGGTVEANNTSQSTEGTFILSDSFNVLNGWQYMPTPETRPVLSPSGRIIFELQTAPGDALTMSGSVTFEEIGG
jgi:hypothetical protein